MLAYLEMFQRDLERLREVRSRVNISPLGSAALAGTKSKLTDTLQLKNWVLKKSIKIVLML